MNRSAKEPPSPALTTAAVSVSSTSSSFSDSGSDSPTESECRRFSELLPPGFLDPLSPEECLALESPPPSGGFGEGGHTSALARTCFSIPPDPPSPERRQKPPPDTSEHVKPKPTALQEFNKSPERPSGHDSRYSSGSPIPQPEQTKMAEAVAIGFQGCNPSTDTDLNPLSQELSPATSLNAPETEEDDSSDTPTAAPKCLSRCSHRPSVLSSSEKEEHDISKRRKRGWRRRRNMITTFTASQFQFYRERKHDDGEKMNSQTQFNRGHENDDSKKMEATSTSSGHQLYQNQEQNDGQQKGATSTGSMYQEYHDVKKISTISTSSQLNIHNYQEYNGSKRSAPSTVPKFPNKKEERCKDSKRVRSDLSVEVCRKFTRGECRFLERNCRYAHPPYTIHIERGDVIACVDFVRGWCPRGRSCLHYHPPPHIRMSLWRKIGAPMPSALMMAHRQQHGDFVTLPFSPQAINGWPTLQNRHISRSGGHRGLLGTPGGQRHGGLGTLGTTGGQAHGGLLLGTPRIQGRGMALHGGPSFLCHR